MSISGSRPPSSWPALAVACLRSAWTKRCAISDEQDLPEVTVNEITGELEIDYPCRWLYKVIGTDEASIRGAVLEVVDVSDVMIELSNTSSAGSFVSINVEVTVESHDERRSIFEALRSHAAVRMVL